MHHKAGSVTPLSIYLAPARGRREGTAAIYTVRAALWRPGPRAAARAPHREMRRDALQARGQIANAGGNSIARVFANK